MQERYKALAALVEDHYGYDALALVESAKLFSAANFRDV